MGKAYHAQSSSLSTPPPLLLPLLLQAADRILLISETRQAVNPALRMPAATSSEQGEAEAAAGARPDLALQHVKLPQQYIEAAYPLVCTAVLRVLLVLMYCYQDAPARNLHASPLPSFLPSPSPFPLGPPAPSAAALCHQPRRR